MTQADDAIRPGADSLVRACAVTTAAGFAGFLVWAGFVPLDEGVAAQGTVIVESSRQVIQHLEGGIIAELHVQEGDDVEAGDPLVVLQETANLAARNQVLQTLAGLRASEIRLLALQSGETPRFEEVRALGLAESDLDPIIARQQRLFEQQELAADARISVLEARLAGARETARLKGEQIAVAERALAASRAQLRTTQTMFDQQMARISEVNALEREVADLEGHIVRLRSERLEARTLAEDLTGQIARTRAEREEALAEELVEVRARLLEAEEELSAVQDVLDRSVISASQDGEVLNLRYASEGGVVRPGDPIMEIVPAGTGLISSVRIRPVDRARVFEGQQVRARIQAYQGWNTPRLIGEVVSVSADLKTDPQSGVEYYEVRIRIPETELVRAEGLELIPGMPVSAFIFSGNRRTMLDYLFEPLGESLFRGLRTS